MANVKNSAKISVVNNPAASAKARALSLAGSLAVKAARKSIGRKNVETGKIGRLLFLETASLYRKVRNEGTPEEYEKVMIRGFDAVAQATVGNIEYHGPEFEGEVREQVFTNFHTRTWEPDDKPGFKMTFDHLYGPMPDMNSELFWNLVIEAQESLNSDEKTDEPEIAV